jgi:hypothetical protein
MKNSVDMVWSSIKELTKQVARDRKWRRSMDERLDKMLDIQESWHTREREKTTESLQMAMNREAKMWIGMLTANRWVSCGFGNYVTTAAVTRLF